MPTGSMSFEATSCSRPMQDRSGRALRSADGEGIQAALQGSFHCFLESQWPEFGATSTCLWATFRYMRIVACFLGYLAGEGWSGVLELLLTRCRVGELGDHCLLLFW